MKPIRDWLGYRLNGLARRLRAGSDEALAPLGLTVKHFAALVALAEEGPAAQHELGSAVGVDRTTMVSLVEDLERAGHIRRARNPADRRAYVIELTTEGTEAIDHATAALERVERELLAPLSAAERRQFAELLALLSR